MDKTTVNQLRTLVRSTLNHMNLMWYQTTGSVHRCLCEAYEDLTKVYELLENEVERLEDDA